MIAKTRPTREARELALEELAEHLGAEIHGKYLVGALPLYRLSQARQNEAKLPKTHKVGTRFVVSNQASADSWVIDIGARRKGQLRLQRLYENWKANALLRACQLAEEGLADSKLRYQARILRMYGRVSEILWLHCKNSPNKDRYARLHKLLPTQACQLAHGIKPDQWLDS